MIKKDTIYALSSGNGKSAVAVFRISGLNSLKIIKNLTKIKKINPRRPLLSKIYKNSLKKTPIDNCVITFMKAPKSYTGEDCVEISSHGGNAVISSILESLGKSKLCRIGEPGEFTRRAFENNKLDLTQVEAISDLVNAETESQRIQALSQLDGNFSKKIQKWSNEILNKLANIEAAIDFSEDEIPKNLIKNNKKAIKKITEEIKTYLDDNKTGELIRSGVRIAILGSPNTGKSSLINYLAKRELSIVSKIKGTTRDVLELNFDIRGIQMIFCDTAGLRAPKNRIEEYGIKKALETGKKSYINVILIKKKEEIEKYNKIFENILFVQSKNDKKNIKNLGKKVIKISSKNGFGINVLLDKIYNKINTSNNPYSNPRITQERHRQLLNLTLENLLESNKIDQIDLIAEEIRSASSNISKITGKNDIDDILDIIFNDFCIGK